MTGVHQTPSDQIRTPGEAFEMRCSNTLRDHDRVHWIKHFPSERRFETMGNLYGDKPNPEEKFNGKITLRGDALTNSTCTMANVSTDDSAVYFCAATSTVRYVHSYLYKNHRQPIAANTCWYVNASAEQTLFAGVKNRADRESVSEDFLKIVLLAVQLI